MSETQKMDVLCEADILAMAKTIASSLEYRGWATGGDYETDFLPDVHQALKIALAKAQGHSHD